MNILLSSTYSWNIGDDWIRAGVVRIITATLGGGHNFFIFNRHPQLLQDYRDNRLIGMDNGWGNRCLPQGMDGVDLVVLAGTPEWHGPVLERLFKASISRNKRIWIIGVGAGDHPRTLTDLDREFVSRAAVVTTRDSSAYDMILPCNPRVKVLPCPAFFAVEAEYPPPTSDAKAIVWIRGGPDTLNRISCELSRDLFRWGLKNKATIICHHVDEGLMTSPLPRRYSYNWTDYEQIYREVGFAVSARCHGSIIPASLNVPVWNVNPGGRHRGACAQIPFIRQGRVEEVTPYQDDVRHFRASKWDEYVATVKNQM